MQKLLTFFSAKILANYAIFNNQSFNNKLTNDIVSFEQLGLDLGLHYLLRPVCLRVNMVCIFTKGKYGIQFHISIFMLKITEAWNNSKRNQNKNLKLGIIKPTLTHKMPRKPASENVVCLCRLVNILANFSNLFLHTCKQCGP